MTLRVVPVTIGEACAFVERHHSHLHAPVSGLCAVGVADGDRLACVAILSRPVSRELQAQGCAEVTRVASDGTEHAAGKALGAITRAALALGWRRLVSSTLLGEAGTIYRACGWCPVSVGGGGQWGRSSRSRPDAIQPGAKVRWETGPDAKPMDPKVDLLVRESVGKVPILKRRSGLPLFDLATETEEIRKSTAAP